LTRPTKVVNILGSGANDGPAKASFLLDLSRDLEEGGLFECGF